MAVHEGVNKATEGLGIGRAVKELRHKKQITLHDLATKTGFSKSVLEEIESGERCARIMPENAHCHWQYPRRSFIASLK